MSYYDLLQGPTMLAAARSGLRTGAARMLFVHLVMCYYYYYYHYA